MKNGNILFFVSIGWIFILFLLWDLRQILEVGFNFNEGVLSDYWAISSQATWMPFIAEISRGNLFPIDPYLGQGDSAFGFFPYVSLWFAGLLASIFGISGAVFIGSSILPTLSYIFMVLIYRCFLNWRWSISLSALGILGFNHAPFREFLFGIFLGEGFLNLGADSAPGVIGFPFPIISLLSFLVVFYYTIKSRYVGKKRSIILSIAWAIQSQVHIVNLIFGVPFWICFLALKIWRLRKNNWTYSESKELLLNIIIIASICMPMVISIFSQASYGLGLDYLVGSAQNENSIDWFFILIYCILPLIVLRIAYAVFRIDPFELLFKFLPVWIAMSIELILVIGWQVFGIGIPSELLLSRLGLFFLHIFYFTPAIYCMHRSTVNYSMGSESLMLSSKIRSFCKWLFRDISLIYLPIIIALLTLFYLVSAEKSYQRFIETGLKKNQKSELIFDLIKSEINSGEVVIGPDNLTNLLLPIKGRYGTLWTNRIISELNKDEVIERFATYAKVIGWTEKQFLEFMLPSAKSFNNTKLDFDVSGFEPVPGLGHWLTFHNNSLYGIELKDYSDKLVRIYNSINYLQKLEEYSVKRIILEKEFSDNFNNNKSKKVESYIIVDFD